MCKQCSIFSIAEKDAPELAQAKENLKTVKAEVAGVRAAMAAATDRSAANLAARLDELTAKQQTALAEVLRQRIAVLQGKEKIYSSLLMLTATDLQQSRDELRRLPQLARAHRAVSMASVSC